MAGAKRSDSRAGGKAGGRKQAPKVGAAQAAVSARPRTASSATPVRRPLVIDLVTFNTHGAVDKSLMVQHHVGPYLCGQPAAAACFQELFFRPELLALDAELLGQNVELTSTGEIEIATGHGGAYARRVTCTSKGLGGLGGGPGLAIYTSLPFTNARFFAFDGLQIPDQLAVKGVLAIDIALAGETLVLAATHFNDDENDRVDGRARRANIATLARMLVTARGKPTIVVGDFNLTSGAATGLDALLFQQLMAVAGRKWIEAGVQNARQNALARPVPTVLGSRRSIDLMLCSGGRPTLAASLVKGSYRALSDFTSDHKLVRASIQLT